MATTTIRTGNGVREEATRIADQLGLTFNAVVNILLMKFNETKGFPFPLTLQQENKAVFDLDSQEFEAACRRAVDQRQAVPRTDYITSLDPDTGMLVKKYWDGRVEYVMD